ncbi:hypothetical protein OIU78_005255 [Salix suchowensis]|nr:hypothetical protein OIU78_005255 [Salix suchowensis]
MLTVHITSKLFWHHFVAPADPLSSLSSIPSLVLKTELNISFTPSPNLSNPSPNLPVTISSSLTALLGLSPFSPLPPSMTPLTSSIRASISSSSSSRYLLLSGRVETDAQRELNDSAHKNSGGALTATTRPDDPRNAVTTTPATSTVTNPTALIVRRTNLSSADIFPRGDLLKPRCQISRYILQMVVAIKCGSFVIIYPVR